MIIFIELPPLKLRILGQNLPDDVLDGMVLRRLLGKCLLGLHLRVLGGDSLVHLVLLGEVLTHPGCCHSEGEALFKLVLFEVVLAQALQHEQVEPLVQVVDLVVLADGLGVLLETSNCTASRTLEGFQEVG